MMGVIVLVVVKLDLGESEGKDNQGEGKKEDVEYSEGVDKGGGFFGELMKSQGDNDEEDECRVFGEKKLVGLDLK